MLRDLQKRYGYNERDSMFVLKDIRTAIKQYLLVTKPVQGGKQVIETLSRSLQMAKDDFESRWTAD